MARNQTPYDRALTLLAFRARSVSELRRALIQKGAPADEVEVVVERLLQQKLLDDADFARQFARRKVTLAGASRLRIVQELRRKGVSASIAEQAFDELRDTEGVDTAAAIERVATRKWESLRNVDYLTRRRRVYAFLARRGFNPDEIRSAISALESATPP